MSCDKFKFQVCNNKETGRLSSASTADQHGEHICFLYKVQCLHNKTGDFSLKPDRKSEMDLLRTLLITELIQPR